MWNVVFCSFTTDEMNTSVMDSREDSDEHSVRSATPCERTFPGLANDTDQQDGLEDTSLQKPQNAEPCISTMESYLLVHFFFIFAASFILGVIFLHSSLSFWTWQVYDDIPPFSAQQAPDAQDSFSYHQNNEHAYRSGFMPYNEVMKAVLSPNMTVSLTR